MKITWGTAIVIVFVLFAAFLTYFMVKSAQHPDSLVTDDYYDQELNYQQKINNSARAKALGNIAFLPAEGNLAITFPASFEAEKATGTIHFYKPDNSSIDKIVDLTINDSNQHIVELDDLIRGKWIIKVSATLNGEGYYWEDSINI